jgi:predicted ArsR family transcriptional regulator
MNSPIDFNGLDTVVHGPARLGILTLLFLDGSLEFTALKKRLGLPDGALGSHLQKLESEGYLKVTKAYVGRRPQSRYTMLPAGRAAFQRHMASLEKLIDAIRK